MATGRLPGFRPAASAGRCVGRGREYPTALFGLRRMRKLQTTRRRRAAKTASESISRRLMEDRSSILI